MSTIVIDTLHDKQNERQCCDKTMRGYDCANNSILYIYIYIYIYSILHYLHLVSLKCVVIVLVIVTTLTPFTAVVNKMLYY